MKQFHVYEDWTTEEHPRCFYVGKGDDDRVERLKRNRYHADVVSLYGHRRIVVYSTCDETEALDKETELILERHVHLRDPLYNGVGCNRTTGGQGNAGRIVTDETRTKISASKRGKTPNKIWSQAERDATSARMSKLHKGKKLSQEQRQFLSDRMADTNIKSKMIEKVTEKIREKYEDPIFKQKIIDTRCRGESSCSPLTEADVRQLRIEWETVDKITKGNKHHQSPARLFCQKWADEKHVTNQAIFAIVTRKTWKHV